MSDNVFRLASAPGQAGRTLAPALALALTLALASTAPAVTMPLHLGEGAITGFTESPDLQPTQTESLRLGEDPTDLGTADVLPRDSRGAAASPISPDGAPRSMPSLAAFPGRVGRDFVHLIARPFTFDAQDWTRLALGAGAVGVVALFDNRIHDSIQGGGSSGANSFATSIRPIGTWGGVALMGAALAGGSVFHDANVASLGMDGIEADLFTGVFIVPLLKKIAGRSRPNAGQGPSNVDTVDGGQSFPSGEVAVAFTNAAVVAQHTDSPVVRGIAWGLAGLVGWERMRLNAHWASDVAAGALIGSAVGTWVAKIHMPEETTSGAKVSVFPLAGPRTVGFTAAVSW